MDRKEVNNLFKKKHLNQRVLLKGGFSGRILGWKKYYDNHFILFTVCIKQVKYKVNTRDIVGWEDIEEK